MSFAHPEVKRFLNAGIHEETLCKDAHLQPQNSNQAPNKGGVNKTPLVVANVYAPSEQHRSPCRSTALPAQHQLAFGNPETLAEHLM